MNVQCRWHDADSDAMWARVRERLSTSNTGGRRLGSGAENALAHLQTWDRSTAFQPELSPAPSPAAAIASCLNFSSASLHSPRPSSQTPASTVVQLAAFSAVEAAVAGTCRAFLAPPAHFLNEEPLQLQTRPHSETQTSRPRQLSASPRPSQPTTSYNC